jgi:ParB family transcriptional regulator, chromosome partitioning protein
VPSSSTAYQDADELPDEIDQRLGEIEAARSVLEARSLVYDPAEIVHAGVFVSIDAEGMLSIARGYVRPEDEAPMVVEPESEAQGDGETNDGPTTNGVVQRGSAARQPNPSRRRTTARSSRCRIGSSPS